MERNRLGALAHLDHPICAPLSDSSVDRLLDRALIRGDERVLDLGCATGTWLVRALTGRPGLHADGVDIDPEAIEQGRAAAASAALADRLQFHVGAAAEFTAHHSYDLVFCIGAVHAFDGLLPALAAACEHLAPDGALLLGDCFWERPPYQATLDAGFAADDYLELAATVDAVAAAGWAPIYGHISSTAEWDDYEWNWIGSTTRWALDHPADPDSAALLEAATAHRRAWLHGYRGTLGFLTLLLRRAPGSDPLVRDPDLGDP